MAKHMAGPQGGHYRLKQPQKREKHNRIPARVLKSRARLLLSGAGCIAAVLIITALLARLLLQIGRSSLSFELPLSFEQAAAYRKANGQYVRKNQWRDTTVRVFIDLD